MQLFETTTGRLIGIISNTTETIDTKNNGSYDEIGSVEFVKLEDLSEILLVGGKNNFGLQIYVKQNNSKYVLKSTLQFEENNKYTFNSTITTNKYMFVKAYQSLDRSTLN